MRGAFVHFLQRYSVSKHFHYAVRELFPMHPTCDFHDKSEERKKIYMCEEGVRLHLVNFRVDLNIDAHQCGLPLSPEPQLYLPTL